MAAVDGIQATQAAHQVEHDPDEEGGQKGYIKATDYSLPYTSPWSRLHHSECGLLRQVNCSYLSTPDVPPTLLSLKQHAQALCVLLLKLVPTLRGGEVDAANSSDPLALKATQNDAFDWLGDLQTPYASDDPDHQKPLNSLLNEVRGRSDASGTGYHCPLTQTRPRGRGEPARPFASHHNLVMHANACLERIDHEFSSEGGLMALLPTDEEHDEADRKDARNSLLGQWLVFSQHLVGRMHELEIAYGNALDALAGEAAVPLQHLSALGPDGRTGGREIAYPQDRWLLVNAGDDVFEHVHGLLDVQEALVQEKERVWRRNGASGERHWMEERGGKAYARGIVPVNITTRYYRLAGHGRSTLFVVPAWDHHPATEQTRALERTPTVVSVVQPKFPQRATELERRHGERLERAQRLEAENTRLAADAVRTRAQLEILAADLERERAANRALEALAGPDGRALAAESARLRAALAHAQDSLASERAALAGRLRELDALQGALGQRDAELVQRDCDIAELREALAEGGARHVGGDLT